MELIQSFIYTISRVRLSLYEQRILLKVVEHAQSRIKGLMIKDNMFQLDHDFDNVKFVIPIKDILTDGSQHYMQVRQAAVLLQSRRFEYQSAGEWFSSPLIYNVSHSQGSGALEFYVARKLFDVILDFSKGFRQFSLQTALSLSSPYASRLYTLVSGLRQGQPLRLEIEELKKMFGVEDKYSQTADFIKKVIVPSQQVLDQAQVNSFTFSRIRKGTKVVALNFFAVKREEPTEEQKLAKLSLSFVMAKDMMIWLMRNYSFTHRELSANKRTLDEFCKLDNANGRLIAICERSAQAKNAKAYIIGAMKKEVSESLDPTKNVPGSSADPNKNEPGTSADPNKKTN